MAKKGPGPRVPAKQPVQPGEVKPRKWAARGTRPIHAVLGVGIDEILAHLREAQRVEDLLSTLPRGPGVYAIYGSQDAWNELGIGPNPDGRPLYVGKKEDDVSTRLRQHFAIGYTNRNRPVTSISSFRRSLAGLLRDSWEIRGVPRFPKKDEPSAQDLMGFGLTSDEQEGRLTDWMHEHLRAAAWVPPADALAGFASEERTRFVEPLEYEIKQKLLCPCNVDRGDPPTQWSSQVKNGRRQMREDAKTWLAERNP